MKNLFFLTTLLGVSTCLNAQFPHHLIHASIDHENNAITVTDSIIFPGEMAGNVLEFALNPELVLKNPDKSIRKLEEGSEKPGEVSEKPGEGNEKPGEGSEKPGEVSEKPREVSEKPEVDGEDGLARSRITLIAGPGGTAFAVLRYSGKIEQKIETGAAEYARGFSTTDGIISPDGIYLAGSTGWVPQFDSPELFTFNLTTDLDEDWTLVSQGTRISNEVENHRRRVEYDSPDPVDEVYFIAGKWTEYSTRYGNVLIQAFLRTPDEELAKRYMDVTSYYLDLFQNLIGDYPYTKFALVENFWETGYGMPSFTLLGEQVIRFPWILHSSYPHELLHNYWGNSVYVDYSQGNWCEGITAYMADHLIKEQQGLGEDYRRTTLQKFTDYVNPENDFPVSEFISRNNPAEEAIGYGKVLMINDMLREEFGDEAFRMAWADFYKRYRFRYASWDDIRSGFERITGKDLQAFFDQWVLRKGAPFLQLSDVKVEAAGKGYKLSYTIKQIQDREPFRLDIPVAIYLEDNPDVRREKVRMDSREKNYVLQLESRPLKISVDPQFDLMRKLHYSEVPSSFSQLFGADHSVFILPGNSQETVHYRELAEFWKETLAAQGKEMKILSDGDPEEIPADADVWVAGYENRFYEGIRIGSLYRDVLPDEKQIRDLARNQSLIYAIPHPHSPGKTIGFIGTHSPETILSLGRKLLHYGSYGYLGFEGSDFTNVLKGSLPVLNSTLDYIIPYEDHPPVTQKLESRRALACPSSE